MNENQLLREALNMLEMLEVADERLDFLSFAEFEQLGSVIYRLKASISHPAQSEGGEAVESLRYNLKHSVSTVSTWIAGGCDAASTPRMHIAVLTTWADESADLAGKLTAPPASQEQSDAATSAGTQAAMGHLSSLVDEATGLLSQLRTMVDDMHKQWSNGGPPERGEFPLLDSVDDWLDARPSQEQANPGQCAACMTPKQCSVDRDEGLACPDSATQTQAQQPQAQRPQNCGTGYCSCIECVMEPQVGDTDVAESFTNDTKPEARDHFPDAGKMIEDAPPADEREAFEREMAKPPFEFCMDRWPDDGAYVWPGNYVAYHTQCAWGAWQARATLSARDAVDAARYRWLADCLNYPEAVTLIADGTLTEDALGKAIDAAMRKAKP